MALCVQYLFLQIANCVCTLGVDLDDVNYAIISHTQTLLGELTVNTFCCKVLTVIFMMTCYKSNKKLMDIVAMVADEKKVCTGRVLIY